MARRVQVPCRRLLRERRDSFLPLPGSHFGAALGHELYETPEISGMRSIVHAILFLTFFYLGFIRKWKRRSIVTSIEIRRRFERSSPLGCAPRRRATWKRFYVS